MVYSDRRCGMKIKMKAPRVIFLIFAYAFLVLISIICFVPLWHVLMSSISNPTQVTTHKGLVLLPLGNMDVKAYEIIGTYKKLWNGYLHTILYIVLSCALTGFSTIIAGYVFSRKKMRFRNFFMMFISFTMLFNGGMIPTFMVLRNLKMTDTIWCLVVPGMLSVFNIILMRTSMMDISDALEDAARIDGAGEFTVLFKIVFPLCKATFAVIMLFTAVAKWNDYFSAMLYLTKRVDLYPLQLVLKQILIDTSANITSTMDVSGATVYERSIQYASIMVSTVPILLVYPFVQKYFVTGMTVGAVKGLSSAKPHAAVKNKEEILNEEVFSDSARGRSVHQHACRLHKQL